MLRVCQTRAAPGFEKPARGQSHQGEVARVGVAGFATLDLTLVFVGRRRCGTSRRMESLLAWVKVTRKKSLRVVEIDADRHAEAAERLAVTTVPTLVLIGEGRIVGRLEGPATGHEIDELISPYLVA